MPLHNSTCLNCPLNRQRGVTLLEVSIVLVIIGLLAGSIFIGKSLMHSAEIRNTASQYETYANSTKTFSDKYHGLPGDLYRADSFWSGAVNGNGNGRIQGAEEFRTWQHLLSAGFIEGTFSGVSGPNGAVDRIPGTNVPNAGLSNAGWGFTYVDVSGANNSIGWWLTNKVYYHVSNIPPENVFWLGGRSPTGTDNEMAVMLTTREALKFDEKFDDGYPGTGKVLVQYNEDSTTHHCKDPNYFGLGQTYYNLTLAPNIIACALVFKSGF